MSEYAHPEVLVDTQWLLEHLHNPTVRVVEINMDPASFQEAHIPGAVCWSIFTDLLNPDLSQNLDPVAISALLSRSGISATTTVIAYGSYPDTGAWIFWLLKTIGHDRVYVLNGGYQKWVAECRPLESEFSSFPPTQYPIRSSDASLRVLLPEVQALLQHGFEPLHHLLLDVRTAPEYRGEIFMMKPPAGSERAGHIPGAVNIEHIFALNEDGTFKSIEALHTLYSSQGITADREVFTYCAIGARSACTWFVLKYLLGYAHVRNYDGSWNQWSKMSDLSIVSTASQF
jgi:thiosulfate/3-mercaptopyruvate sulfurtransferase